MTRASSCVARRAWIVSCLVLSCALEAAARDDVGVLVIAHGGSNQWDSAVRKAVKEAKLSVPTEVALGMGMHPEEVRQFQQAVDRLERKGVSRIVVVPLLVSSHSEVFRQYAYLVGIRPTAEWPEAGEPLDVDVPVVMGRALDDDPVVAQILLERARRLSRRTQEETVILVAHGPVAQIDDQRWLDTMSRVAQRVKADGPFRDVLSFTIRDDAPRAVKEEAQRRLREAVRASGQQGRALIVPLLLARGGIERKIPKLLAGLTYVYKGETLLPHKRMVQWLAREAARLAAEPPVASSEQPHAVIQ